MIFRFIYVFLILLSLPTFGYFAPKPTTKEHYPKDFFILPVKMPAEVTGTFGELRPDHFHSGLDLKPIKGSVGATIFAAAEGYISKIMVRADGYGKHIQIQHPNGFTTLYAHLDSFSSNLADLVKNEQYARQQFEVELLFKPNEMPIRKGQEIGKMGNSGSSGGPHLHFEIRDSITGVPINPLLFGLPLADNFAPAFFALKVYSLNDIHETVFTRIHDLILKKNGDYGVKGDTLVLGAWRAGFGIKTYDPVSEKIDKHGIYRLSMYENDALKYQFSMDKIPFDETRYLNAHLDYAEQIARKSYFHRCYRLAGNHLAIYNTKDNDGVINLQQQQATKITLIAEDIRQNKTKMTFWVRRAATIETPLQAAPFHYTIPYVADYVIKTDALQLKIPKNSLYENLYMSYQTAFDASGDVFSATHFVHHFRTPVHRYMELAIKPNKAIPTDLKDKMFIANCDKEDAIINCGGQWQGDMLMTKIREMGRYCIMIDNVPPTIRAVSFKPDMRNASRMTFLAKDNVIPNKNLKGIEYRATVDDSWVLMEYDAKNNALIHKFDGRISKGEHILKLTVKDAQGNEAIFERKFIK